MINDRYYIKIVPQKGDTVHRFEVRRRHMWAAVAALALVVLGSGLFAGYQVIHARLQVAHLQQQAEAQRASLSTMDRQTDDLRRQLQHVQKQNEEIQQAIGVRGTRPPAVQKTSWTRPHPTLDAVAEHIATLSVASLVTQQESDHIKSLAMHVLNMRHVADLARAREIAFIPSIDPVEGAAIVGCYCYRTYPDVEFHPGVDLEADYGTPVRASAAGTVVANGYDGGYGIKIDIDHGNGYHTWYAHLEAVDVAVGTHVYKGQQIGHAGATGFATGPHLHYQVMYNGSPVDPTPFLSGVPPSVLASLP